MDDGWTGSPGGDSLRQISYCAKSGLFKLLSRNVSEPQVWVASPTGFDDCCPREVQTAFITSADLWALASSILPPPLPSAIPCFFGHCTAGRWEICGVMRVGEERTCNGREGRDLIKPLIGMVESFIRNGRYFCCDVANCFKTQIRAAWG